MGILEFKSQLTRGVHTTTLFSVVITWNSGGLVICGRKFMGRRLYSFVRYIIRKAWQDTWLSISRKILRADCRGHGRGFTKASLRHGMTLKESQENRESADSEYCFIGGDVVELDENHWRLSDGN